MKPDRRQALRLAGAALALGLAGRAHPEDSARVIPIVARKFEFIPAEVRIARGEAVILELTSPDAVMGFALPDLNLRADLVPGRVARLELRPEAAGTIAFHCDVFCGSGHEGMQGALVVSD